MRRTARRIYGTMVANCDDEMLIDANLSRIASLAGYNSVGGAHTSALEWLEEHNKITKLKGDVWRVWL